MCGTHEHPCTCRRQSALAAYVTLDGTNDAMLHPVDPEGHPYIEYVRDRGSHADLPFEEIRETLAATYGPPSGERGQ